MADAKQDEVELVIPKETQEKYPELVLAIKASKSMDNKERNYWLQVLPVMTEDQVNELRGILDTEKKKLAEIEAKYAKKGENNSKKPEKTEEELKEEEEKRRKEREERKKQEELARKEENVDDILSLLDDL